MDITLERILFLIPKKPNGKFVHGAVKEFANGLGLKTGNIVSDWIAGRSHSYEGYLYQISAQYGVSIEWLKGKTDDPQPSVQKETPAPIKGEQIPGFDQLTPENQEFVRKQVDLLLAAQQGG